MNFFKHCAGTEMRRAFSQPFQISRIAFGWVTTVRHARRNLKDATYEKTKDIKKVLKKTLEVKLSIFLGSDSGSSVCLVFSAHEFFTGLFIHAEVRD